MKIFERGDIKPGMLFVNRHNSMYYDLILKVGKESVKSFIINSQGLIMIDTVSLNHYVYRVNKNHGKVYYHEQNK